jgi:hypothetical protein
MYLNLSVTQKFSENFSKKKFEVEGAIAQIYGKIFTKKMRGREPSHQNISN